MDSILTTQPLMRRTSARCGVWPDRRLLSAILGFLATALAWWEMLSIGAVNPDASHLLLAPPAALLAVWCRRRVFEEACGHNLWAPVVATLGMALALSGRLLDLRFPWHLGAVLITVAAILWPHGPRAARALLFPLSLLLFCVPLPGRIDSLITAPLTSLQLRLIDGVAWLTLCDWQTEGQIILVRGTEVALEKGCAGFRLIWPTAISAVTAACIATHSLSQRLLIAGLAPLCALGLNFLRVLATLALYNAGQPVLADQVHDALGVGLLALAVVVPFWLLPRLTPPLSPSCSPRDPQGSPHAGRPSRLWSIGGGLACLVILVLYWQPVVAQPTGDQGRHLARSLATELPTYLDGWIGEDVPLDSSQADRLQADQVVYREYRNWSSQAQAQVLISFHADGQAHRGHSAERCYPARGWSARSAAPCRFQSCGRTREGREHHFERPSRGAEGLVVTEFSVWGNGPGHQTASPWNWLTPPSPTGSARIQILTPATQSPEIRAAFVRQVLAALEPWLHELEGAGPDHDSGDTGA